RRGRGPVRGPPAGLPGAGAARAGAHRGRLRAPVQGPGDAGPDRGHRRPARAADGHGRARRRRQPAPAVHHPGRRRRGAGRRPVRVRGHARRRDRPGRHGDRRARRRPAQAWRPAPRARPRLARAPARDPRGARPPARVQPRQGAGRTVTSRSANAEQAYRWNGEGGRYWIDHRERLLAGHRNLHPHLLRGAALTSTDRVLDVGCGCGGTTLLAARAAHRVVGLDLSGPMLAVARDLAEAADAANTAFVRGDAQDSPLRPSSCDVLISSFGVMFFADPAAAFANLARAVRPGGRLAFLCWQYELDNEYFAIPLRAFATLMPLPGPTPAGRIFADPALLSSLLSGAGWAGVRIEAVAEPAWLGADTAD